MSDYRIEFQGGCVFTAASGSASGMLTASFKILEEGNPDEYVDDFPLGELGVKKIEDGSSVSSPTFSFSISNGEYTVSFDVSGFAFEQYQIVDSSDRFSATPIPYEFKMKLMKEVSYVCSIGTRLAHIPFMVVGERKVVSNGNVSTEPVEIARVFNPTVITGSYEQNEVEFPTDSEDYPRQWSDESGFIADNPPLTVENVWDGVSVERNGDSGSSDFGMYHLNVPFGVPKVPQGLYVELRGGIANWSDSEDVPATLDGYYAKSVSSTGTTTYPKYTKKVRDGLEYRLECVMLYAYGSSNMTTGNASSFEISDKGASSGSLTSKYDFRAWVIKEVVTDGEGGTPEEKILYVANNCVDNGTRHGYSDGYSYTPGYDAAFTVSSSFAKGYTTVDMLVAEYSYSGSGSTYRLKPTDDSEVRGIGECITTEKDGRTEDNIDNTVFFGMKDGYGNFVNPRETKIRLYRKAPNGLFIRLKGSSGEEGYTGYYRKYGRFFPSEYCTATFGAMSDSDLEMTYSLAINNGNSVKSIVTGRKLVSKVAYRHLMKLGYAKNGTGILTPDEYGTGLLSNGVATVTLSVTDEAGNTSTKNASISWIPQLYRTKHLNLRTPSGDYSHNVFGVSGEIAEKQTGSTISRSWNEIWYPSTHGSPLNADGSINATAALRIASGAEDSTGQTGPTSEELLKYDRLAVSNVNNTPTLAKDSEGRYLQNISAWDTTKRYPAKENSQVQVSNGKYQTYWIIDNSGNPDFRLEFEVFDFSSSITRFPENVYARTTGDSVSVFDASDDGCVYSNPEVDSNGNRKWVLKDSSKLNLLFTLKGSALKNKDSNPPVILVEGDVDGVLEDTGNGFKCPSITSCSRICIVPFTDFGTDDDSRGSGFKLKAGPSHYNEYYNYEYFNGTGEFWVHRNNIGTWDVPPTVNVKYDYYESTASINVETGAALFSSRQLYPVLGTFSCYLYLKKQSQNRPYSQLCGYPHMYFSERLDSDATAAIRTFVASQDDLQDYSNKSFYVSYSGAEPVKSGTYDATASTNDSSGRLSSYAMDNDTGIIQFSGNPPRGRIFGDYYYHTFYRLTSDGYGDLYFYGTGVLVPASATSSYTDWTYVDLKIINEGGNTLNDGALTFLARGYITKGTVVDTVLDQNRPWDVQEGTTAETVNRTGAVCEASYSALNTKHAANRVSAFAARSTQTLVFGTLEPKQATFVRVFWCIAQNSEGTAWIDCTRGNKVYSAELSGTYFIYTS